MGFLDLVGQGVQTYVDIENIKDDYSQGTQSLLKKMAGNNGQETLTDRYADNVDAYVDEVAENWSAHNWPNYLRIVAGGTSQSGIQGTIIILNAGFDYLSYMIAEIQATLAQAAADLALEGMDGERRHGRGGVDVEGIRRKADSFHRRSTGGDFSRNGGLRSTRRHVSPGADIRNVRDRDDFYRRLDAPGLPGLRARLDAGGTDQQMRLFMDFGNRIDTPISITIPGGTRAGQRLTMIPGQYRWDGFNYSGSRNMWVEDPSGALYDSAMRYWNQQISIGERNYRQGGSEYDAFGNKKPGSEGYNPYTMQRQQQQGRFPGAKTWEGNSVPYGIYSR